MKEIITGAYLLTSDEVHTFNKRLTDLTKDNWQIKGKLKTDKMDYNTLNYSVLLVKYDK